MTTRAKKLALIGGGGFSKEIAEVARLRGYVVEATYSSQARVSVGQYRGYLDQLLVDKALYDGVALAVGGISRESIKARAEIIAWLSNNQFACPALVSPHAIVSDEVQVEPGAFIAHGSIINVAARVGRFSVLNTASIIGHDTSIGENTTISPGVFIGGRCSIGCDSLIGPLAKILQGLKVGERVMIGMDCNILRSLPDDATVWPRPDAAVRDIDKR